MAPAYDWGRFLAACGTPGSVYVRPGPLNDAELHFTLHSQAEVLDFVATEQWDSVVYYNTRPLELWNGPPPAPLVDAYRFILGSKHGYFAFFQGPAKWIIKSFHLDSQSQLTHNPFSAINLLKGTGDS